MLEGLAGGLLGGLGALGAQGVSRDMAREQMQFQEQMSNTAYQRATTDMQKAGINPMLAYMKGGADSAPGAVGTAENVVHHLLLQIHTPRIDRLVLLPE